MLSKKIKYLGVLLCLVLAVSVLRLDYNNYTQPAKHYFNLLGKPVSSNAISTYSFSGTKLKIHCDLKNDPFFSIDFPVTLHQWKRLRLDYDKLRGIKKIQIYYQTKGGGGFSEKQSMEQQLDSNLNYADLFVLPPGEYVSLRIDFEGGRKTGTAIITDLQLIGFGFFFGKEFYLYLIAFGILCLLVLPGTFLYVLLVPERRQNSNHYLLLFFTFTLLFYISLYLCLYGAISMGLHTGHTVLASFFILASTLVFTVWKKGRVRHAISCLKNEKQSMTIYLLIVLVSTVLFTRFAHHPFSFSSINWNSVDAEVTFSKFSAHDNMFQYVNGKVIAEDELFSKYYANRNLTYNVQEREMLPGVIYGVFRSMLSAISQYIGKSYLTYSLLGLAMNAMVIFPLIVLYRRYFHPCSESIFIFLLSCSTFVLPNYYFTWFKFSGAALFISGVALLLLNKKGLSSWLIAGLLFGLSCNMHAGNALGIPVILLWIMFLTAREKQSFLRGGLLYPFLLTMVFIITLLPWSIVKSFHFPDQHTLIKEHFFYRYGRGESLLTAAKIFFAKIPLADQLDYRLHNIAKSFRLNEIGSLITLFQNGESRNLARQWNNLEFVFLIFSLYPLVIIGFLSKLFQRLTNQSGVTRQPTYYRTSLSTETTTFLLLNFVTLWAIIFVSYNGNPDLTFHLPMGIILLVQMLLFGISYKSGLFGRILLFSLATVSIWRIATHFFMTFHLR